MVIVTLHVCFCGQEMDKFVYKRRRIDPENKEDDEAVTSYDLSKTKVASKKIKNNIPSGIVEKSALASTSSKNKEKESSKVCIRLLV